MKVAAGPAKSVNTEYIVFAPFAAGFFILYFLAVWRKGQTGS
jgi:hypothetical protein